MRDASIEFVVTVVRRLIERHELTRVSSGVPSTGVHSHTQPPQPPPALSASGAEEVLNPGPVDATWHRPAQVQALWQQIHPVRVAQRIEHDCVIPDDIDAVIRMRQQAARVRLSHNDRTAAGSDR